MVANEQNSNEVRLSVIIAVQFSQDNLAAIFDALGLELHQDVEVLLCYSSDDPVSAELAEHRIRLIEARADSLIPQLWRDGIIAATSNRVALLTSHCVPSENWVNVLKECDLEENVAIGGIIRDCDQADMVGKAIHLLRYASYSDFQDEVVAAEIAADNAIYRRDEILNCADLMELGFWEPSYHERFRAKGLTMKLTPDLQVVHRNQYSPRQFMRQRRRHGRAFGHARSVGASSMTRGLMLVTAPLAFLIHALKRTFGALRSSVLRSSYFASAPLFYLFMLNWNWGEAQGYADAFFENESRLNELRKEER